jgi:HK97 family phage major capsid protein
MWKDFQSGSSELKKAMAGASGSEGEDWIPTGFSADLIGLVRLELKVANLFRTITMPTNPYKFPVQLTDATGYLQSESVDDSAAKFKASTPTTSNLTLTAVKLACRTLFSEELSEDSIVPILPFLKANVVTAIAIANEKAVINGDESGSTAGSHMDTNVTTVTDAQAAWDGLRHAAIAGSAEVDIATPALETIRSIRTKMGVYGVDPSKLVWVTGISGYIQMLSMKDSNSAQVLSTIDKYGPNATVLSGELAKFDGSPVIVSEYIYQNLGATGIYSASLTKTILLCVYVPGHIMGDRRRVTVKTDQNIETDQQILVVTERKDFTNLYAVATHNIVGQGYNLAV